LLIWKLFLHFIVIFRDITVNEVNTFIMVRMEINLKNSNFENFEHERLAAVFFSK
jgi:hypothetical protein